MPTVSHLSLLRTLILGADLGSPRLPVRVSTLLPVGWVSVNLPRDRDLWPVAYICWTISVA